MSPLAAEEIHRVQGWCGFLAGLVAGLGPAIHEKPLVGPRAKPGEDELGCSNLNGFGSRPGASALPLGRKEPRAAHQCARIWLRNSRVRSLFGLAKNSSGGARSTISPRSMN